MTIRENLVYDEYVGDNTKILKGIIRKYVATLKSEIVAEGHEVTSHRFHRVLKHQQGTPAASRSQQAFVLEQGLFRADASLNKGKSLTSRFNNWTSMRKSVQKQYHQSVLETLDQLIDTTLKVHVLADSDVTNVIALDVRYLLLIGLEGRGQRFLSCH